MGGRLLLVKQPRPGGWGADAASGFSQAGRGLAYAFGFVGTVLLFWFLGRLADNWLDTTPWLQVVGTLIGWPLGFVVVYYGAQERKP
jgi:F0F1-type ATP synthase assembly protein I